ncbi:MAG TPA: helix-turn-helix domain-containing protein [Flavobacterium sp.]|jgi:excisionase family DNA binding protein
MEHTLIGITPETLQDFLIRELKPLFDDLKASFSASPSSALLTREEAGNLLRIDLSTLYKWTKQGKLKSYGLGGRIYYKQHEIEEALVKIEN